MINSKNLIVLFVITTVASTFLTITPSAMKLSNAAEVNQNTIDCNSKKGTANTFAGNLNFGGVKCEGQNGGTASLIGIRSNSTPKLSPSASNSNIIDCNSKKGTANTFAGNLNFGGVKCEGQNGGTASAGAAKLGPNSLSIHSTQGPNDGTHIGGAIRR